MKKVIPLRPARQKRQRTLRTSKDQPSPPPQPDLVTVLLNDGTCETVSGKNLELDIEYQDGVPYLVVRARR